MTKEVVGEIRISKRIVRIGHQDYPLANISRVQSLRLVWAGKLATAYPARQMAALLLVVGVVFAVAEALVPGLNLDTGFDVEGTARRVASGVAVLAGIRIAYLLAVLIYRLLIRRPQYALVIETAGAQSTALSGTDRAEIDRIQGVLVDAIENPPPYEKTVQVRGDLVLGDKVGRDKYQQDGVGNRMHAAG